MMKKSNWTWLLLAVFCLAGCTGGDEASIRSTIESAFNAAQQGDIEQALKQLSPSNPLQQQLAAIESEPQRDRLLADLSARALDSLQNATIRITAITTHGNRATARIELPSTEKVHVQEVRLEKQGDDWKLLDLPAFVSGQVPALN